MLLDLP